MTEVHTDDGASLARHFKRHALSYARSRAVEARVLIQFGDARLLVRIEHGRVVGIADSMAPLSSWDFSVRAPADAWSRFWRAVPAAGSHDIFALARNGEMAIEGDLHPFMANLQYMKDLLAIGREACA